MIYVSHSIRGRFGVAATKEQMETNCNIAKDFADWLRNHFPEEEFYVPGESEPFVSVAYWHEYLTEEQILFIDCEIVSHCKAMLVFSPDDFISKGMQVEIDHCIANNIPYLIVDHSIKEKQRIKDFLYQVKGLKNG